MTVGKQNYQHLKACAGRSLINYKGENEPLEWRHLAGTTLTKQLNLLSLSITQTDTMCF